MSQTPMTFEALMLEWVDHPLDESWVAVVRSCVEAIEDPQVEARAAMQAWQHLAMLFGDSGAPEFCVVSAMHAMSLDPNADESLARLRSHANLALLDLGLATPVVPDQPLAIVDLEANMKTVAERVAAWLDAFVAPFGGVANAAAACLTVAAIRAGLAPRPHPLTMSSLTEMPGRSDLN